MIQRLRCAVSGLVCASAVLLWQAATVRYNYGGNWTALFCTGEKAPLPPALESEHIYRFAGSYGFDGQLYHYIAHDPLLRLGLDRFIDAPRLRYPRILVPGLAHLLALGRTERIDWAYRAVIVLFFFAGAYWLGRVAQSRGCSSAWGAAFFFVPAAIVSADRLTVDVSLAALSVAFALYAREEESSAKLYAILVLAGLARDTGVLLVAAWCLWLLQRRQWRRAALFSTAALPMMGWYAFVFSRTSPYRLGGSLTFPLGGLADRFLHPLSYALPAGPALLAVLLDYVALLGTVLALGAAIWVALRRGFDAPRWAMLLFVALAVFLWRPGEWTSAYEFPRILSPLIILLAIEAMGSFCILYVAPLGLVLPRLGLQVGLQVAGVVQGVLGFRA